MSLTISSTNSVVGSGFGCSFSGSITQPSASKMEFVASLHAAGCSNPAFDGAYGNVKLKADDNALEIEIEREVEASGTKAKVSIEGTLRH